jgi:hypothetical protein
MAIAAADQALLAFSGLDDSRNSSPPSLNERQINPTYYYIPDMHEGLFSCPFWSKAFMICNFRQLQILSVSERGPFWLADKMVPDLDPANCK